MSVPAAPAAIAWPAGMSPYAGAVVVGAIVALTLLGAVASALVPELAPAGYQHATLHGTLPEAAEIFIGNARLLAAPLIVAAARWPSGRVTRHLGDILVAAVLVVNPFVVGFAGGRFSVELVPYLPHLPLEDAALATAVTAWVSRRLPRPAGRAPWGVLRYASLTLALTAFAALAALAETFLVPHARAHHGAETCRLTEPTTAAGGWPDDNRSLGHSLAGSLIWDEGTAPDPPANAHHSPRQSV